MRSLRDPVFLPLQDGLGFPGQDAQGGGGAWPEPRGAQVLKRHCAGGGGVWPYFVPAGGFMCTPPLDTAEVRRPPHSSTRGDD